MIIEGDFVMCPEGYEDKPLVGQVEYVMTEGMFGIPGSEYAIEASLEEPAVLVRHFEEEDGVWEAEMVLSGHKASHLVKIESLKVERDVVTEEFSSTDSETQMAMYDSQIGKAAPCWDGYVQRGMKEQGGQMVPNCIPVAKSDEIVEDLGSFAGIGKDYTKSTKEVHRVEE
jgi:hypothetical protein